MTTELWQANMKDYIAAFLLKITETSQWITNFISRRRGMLWIIETKTCLKNYLCSYLVEHLSQNTVPWAFKAKISQSRKLNHSLNKHTTTCTIDSLPALCAETISFLTFYSLFTTLSSFRFFTEVSSLLERCISEFKLLFFYTVRSLILLHEKFLQFEWLIAVVFPLNLKYLKYLKISTNTSVICTWYVAFILLHEKFL